MTTIRFACGVLAACAWLAGAQAQVRVTPIYTFKTDSGVSQPVGNVHLGQDGKLRGVAEGVTWEMNTDGSGYRTYPVASTIVTHLYGAQYALSSTVADGQGNYYGNTFSGGSSTGKMGVLYRFRAGESAVEVLAPSQAARPEQMSQASGNLSVDAAGNVYVLDRGSSVGTGLREGAIKRLSADGSSFTIVLQMKPETGSNAAVVLPASDGWLYGVAGQGGAQSLGTIFRLRPSGADFSVLHHFRDEDGQPAQYRGTFTINAAGLVEVGNWLIGTTYRNGAHGDGAVYRIRKDGSGFRVLHAFHDAADKQGKSAAGTLVLAPDGNVYGTTNAGGANDDGTLFRIVAARMEEADGGFEFLHSFKLDVDGKLPLNLSLGHDGRLYGNTISGNYSAAHQGTIYVVDTGYVPPADPPEIALFRAAPDRIDLGQYTTLAWSTRNVARCTAGGAWQGARAGSGTEVVTPATPGHATFTLSCEGSDGNVVQESAVVEVVPPPDAVIRAFTATPVVAPLGSSVELAWDVADTLGCTAAGSWSGDKPASGTESVTPAAGDHVFRLDCRGAGADDSREVAVRITLPAVIERFAADSVTLAPGGATTLRWQVRDATQCQASGAWDGERAATGTLEIQPAVGEHSYNLRCTGEGGNALSTVRVVVAAPAVVPDAGNGGAWPLALLPVLAPLAWRRRRARHSA